MKRAAFIVTSLLLALGAYAATIGGGMFFPYPLATGPTTGGGGGSPYYFNNFNSGTDGAVVSGMTDNAGTVYDSTQAYGGSGKSAKIQITSGSGGFGYWGGIVPITPALVRYQEIWVRVRVRFPSGFNWTNSDGNPFLKFIRLKNETAGGSHIAYNDLYSMSPTNGAFPNGVQYIQESEQNWKYSPTSFTLAANTWATYEIYQKLDSTLGTSGGQARTRVWKDCTLAMDFNDRITLSNSTAVIPYLYLYTYWNQVAPATQNGWMDDVTIYTSASPPTNTDGSGNTYIGCGAP